MEQHVSMADTALILDDVSVSHDASDERLQHALLKVTTRVAAGRVTAVVGRSAAGKTTLLQCLAGIVLPTQGAVLTAPGRLGPEPVNVFVEHAAFSKHIGLALDRGTGLAVTQSPYMLLHELADLRGMRVTVRTNLHIMEVLQGLGLHSVRHSLIGDLSDATRARVAIAAAVVGFPRLVIIDEPTTSLDPVHRRVVWDYLLGTVCVGRRDDDSSAAATADGGVSAVTLVVATPDPVEAARYADDIIALDNGKLTYAGCVGAWPANTQRPNLLVRLSNDGGHGARQKQREDTAALLQPYLVGADPSSSALTATDFTLLGGARSSFVALRVEAAGGNPGGGGVFASGAGETDALSEEAAHGGDAAAQRADKEEQQQHLAVALHAERGAQPIGAELAFTLELDA